jgi:hypothetical protein
MSNAQPRLSSEDLFTQCGHALCGHGGDWRAKFGQLLGGLKPDRIDAMAKGDSRISPMLWGAIAVHLHDRGYLDLVSLRDLAIEASGVPLCRVYTVRNIEFSVTPSIDGRWPTLRIANLRDNLDTGWWRPVGPYQFRLPDDTMSAMLEFDGECGPPFPIQGGLPVYYPENMVRPKEGVTPLPAAHYPPSMVRVKHGDTPLAGDLDETELNDRAESARRAWLAAQQVVTRRFAGVASSNGPNPTMQEIEDAKYLKRIYEELHSRRLAAAARRYAAAG